jgi:hypothetical protein
MVEYAAEKYIYTRMMSEPGKTNMVVSNHLTFRIKNPGQEGAVGRHQHTPKRPPRQRRGVRAAEQSGAAVLPDGLDLRDE